MLAEGYFLRGGKRAKVTLVDFLGLDVEREMPCQVALDSGRVVAQIATVGLPFHHGIGIVDVGLVHAVEVLLHAAVGGHRRKSLRVFRMILHMSHQWSFFATRVLAISALERFFARVRALVFDERAFRGSRVDADVATEWFLSRMRA